MYVVKVVILLKVLIIETQNMTFFFINNRSIVFDIMKPEIKLEKSNSTAVIKVIIAIRDCLP